MKKKYVIYTSLTGGYDELRQPLAVDDRFDYICFTNDFPEGRYGVWKIRKIPYQSQDNTRLSRYVKLLPHKVLSEYEYSLWMDSNIQIAKGMFYDYVMKQIESECMISQVNHVVPSVDCIYDEICFAFEIHKVRFFPAYKQKCHLKKNHFPRHYGLFENNLILRRHNNDIVKLIDDEWWQEYCNYSKRDQFSLMFVYWRNSFLPTLLLEKGQCARNVDFLNIETYHHEQKGRKKKCWEKIISFPDRILYHFEYTKPDFFLKILR